MAIQATGKIKSFVPANGTPQKANSSAPVTATADISVPKAATDDVLFLLSVTVGEHGFISIKTLHPGESSTLSATLSVHFPSGVRSIDVTAGLLARVGQTVQVLDEKVNNYPISP